MAKYGERLHIYSYSGPDPEVEITEHDWSGLESSFGCIIEPDMRKALLGISNRYLFSRRSELGAATQKDVTDIARDAQKAIAGFTSFAHGVCADFTSAEPNSEEWWEFDTRFKMLAEQPGYLVRLSNGNLVDENGEALENTAVQPWLKLTPTLLSDIAIQLNVLLASLSKGEGAIPGFKQGEAFKRFLLDVKLWAKDHGLPHSPYISGSNKSEAGPIAKLCFDLEKLFPSEFRANPNSSTAVAAQMERQYQLKRRLETASLVSSLVDDIPSE